MRTFRIVTSFASTVIVPAMSRPSTIAPSVVTWIEPLGVSVVPAGTPVLVGPGFGPLQPLEPPASPGGAPASDVAPPLAVPASGIAPPFAVTPPFDDVPPFD